MGSNVQIGPQTLKLQLDQIFVLTISHRLCSKKFLFFNFRANTSLFTELYPITWTCTATKMMNTPTQYQSMLSTQLLEL